MRLFFRIVFLRLLPFLILAALLIGLERTYFRLHSAVIDLGKADHAWLYIPTGAGFSQVKDSLYHHGFVRKRRLFENFVEIGHYDRYFKPGRYRLRNHMSSQELVDLLIRGLQTPVNITFHNIRTREELAGIIARQIEADSLSLLNLFNNNTVLAQYDVTPMTLFTMTIPNTYEMWWNSTAADFLARMATESRKFWSGSRTRKADSVRLSIPEVVTLASIIEKETAMNEEKPLIAGVYMNRLHRKWPLQADPTLIYAWNDFTIKRVLNRHKEINSPYNTYKNAGLPPGPICIPSIASIDAVLNYRHHDYLYFCAREDFSGYHVFSTSLRDHNRNARRYQEALNKLKIDN
ncbi:MAG: endolytic transglycosylase MltG [Bacteroidetes bacterium]|nr:MAG: endolytic transglycosylase MltG [Bacteroidota bacterium]